MSEDLSRESKRHAPNYARAVGSAESAYVIKSLLTAIDSDLNHPEHFGEVKFALDYLKQGILSKYSDPSDPSFASAEDRRAAAIVKWLAVEQRNQGTNRRLWTSESYIKGVGFTTDIIQLAAKLARQIVGDSPPPHLINEGSFSGGASTCVTRNVGTLERKFIGERDVTARAWKHLDSIDAPGWSTVEPSTTERTAVMRRVNIVKGNVLFTVPKNSVIDRVAAKEPGFNMFCQKAAGDFIRKRLKTRARVDLNDQRTNQKLAYEGSKYGKLATIDLSSASDSLTRGLVCMLLPHAWYELLSDLRCDLTNIDGVSHVNEMFSSMGNGFTFELESLVFFVLTRATAILAGKSGRITVYGDDIIAPADVVPMLVPVLNFCGFSVNEKKTFYTGDFRESCGKHYMRGVDVSPFFVRGPFEDTSDIIHTLNQLREWLVRLTADVDYDGQKSALCLWWNAIARAFVPRSLWGGRRTDVRTQLASPGRPKCRLVEESYVHEKATRKLAFAGYLSRLAEMSFRASSYERVEPVDFWELRVQTRKYQIVRFKDTSSTFGLERPAFLSEWL